jgi:hypothetical protein
VPFELIVERLCQRYGKLPSEILEQELDWIRILLEITILDEQRKDLENKRANLKNTKNG